MRFVGEVRVVWGSKNEENSKMLEAKEKLITVKPFWGRHRHVEANGHVIAPEEV